MKKNFLLLPAALLLFNACSKGTGTPEQVPRISITDNYAPEGNGGNRNVEFEVTLSNAISKQVTVNYSTQDGNAVAGEDYVAVTNGQLVFNANETSKKILIAVIGDDIKEGNERFHVQLSGAKNATIYKENGTAEMTNDDTRIAFTDKGYTAPTSYPGYTLSWSDEFNGTALDQNSWVYDLGDGCPNLCGWGNNELQFYTNSPENLFFQDGKMIIEAKKEAYSGKEYTSSRIKTAGKKSWKHGRIDFRAKLPKGKGIWPAFWMMPEKSVFGGWPKSGELDIMEVIGSEPSKLHGTLHFGPGPASVQISRSYTLPTGTFHDEFHVFSIEWKQDQIQWLIDGNVFSTANKADFGTNQYPFNEEFHMIINLAVGGNWPGSPDATTVFPQHLIVDYVRVYQ